MVEHNSPSNRDRVKPKRVTKADRAWYALLGKNEKLYRAWEKFVKENNLPWNHK